MAYCRNWTVGPTIEHGLHSRPRRLTPERSQVKNPPTWLLQVYEMSDLPAQESALSVLSDMPGLTVDARTCDRGSYVVVECEDATQGMSVYELVMMADRDAELIHSTTSPREVKAVKDRMRPEGETASLSDGDLLDA